MNLKVITISVITVLLIQFPANGGGQVTTNQDNTNLTVSVNLEYILTKTGDEIHFESTVLNTGEIVTSKLIVAMNIVNLQDGAPVDPEDWSPQRTQFINPLAPGISRTLSWTVYTILKGDYSVYLVVIPIPTSQDQTSIPISSPAIHVTVSEFSRLNPQGILPFVIGIPIFLSLIFLFIRKRRNRFVEYS